MESADLRLIHTKFGGDRRQGIVGLNRIRLTGGYGSSKLLIHQRLNGVITTTELLLASIAVTEFTTNHSIGEIVIGTPCKRIGRL